MKTKPSLKIFTLYYKVGKVLASKPYIPLLMHHEFHTPAEFLSDNSGMNISERNKYFSELTGIFWFWKNQDADIMGCTHYRRYFTLQKEPWFYRIKRLAYYPLGLHKKRHGLIYTGNTNFWKSKILNEKEILTLLDSHDAIMPERRILKYSIKEHYLRYHTAKDLQVLTSLLKIDYPEYVKSYETVMADNRLFANNMFILRKDKFEALMTWLFDILFKLENELDLDQYKDYQERVLGFLSERLITIWMIHNQLVIKELPLIYFKKLKKYSS